MNRNGFVYMNLNAAAALCKCALFAMANNALTVEKNQRLNSVVCKWCTDAEAKHHLFIVVGIDIDRNFII